MVTWLSRSRYLAAAVSLHLALAAVLSWHVLAARSALQPEPGPVVLDVEFVSAALPEDPAERSGMTHALDGATEAEPVQELPAPVEHEPMPSPAARPSSDAGDGVSAELAAVADPVSEDHGPGLPPALPAETVASEVGVAPAPSDGVEPDTELEAWERDVIKRLDANKRYPARAQFRGQEDVVVVQVRVDRRGEVVSRRVIASRGYGLLDREALALVDRSSPLPSPPEQVGDAKLEFRVPVAFHIRQRIVRDW